MIVEPTARPPRLIDRPTEGSIVTLKLSLFRVGLLCWVRGLALINAADSHPLIVPRVRHYLTDVLKVSEQQRLAWIQHWLGAGLEAIETLLAEHPASGRFCHGDGPTVADICLVTQVTPAKTFNCALAPYPRVMRIYDTCMAIPAFADAHPAKQPDAE